MLGVFLGLCVFLPAAVWLVGFVQMPRWLVSAIFLACALALHYVAYRLQMRFVAARAPHLLKGSFVRRDAIEYIPRWTTQFTGAAIAAVIGIGFVWIVRF